MDKCSTCKHFGSQGRIGLVKEEGKFRYCSAFLFSDEDNPNFVPMPHWKVTYGSSGGSKGELVVNENFGCVNHNKEFD